MKKRGYSNLVLLISVTVLFGCTEPRSTKPNILFIAVDDLRPELYCYGATHIKSPNIDRLAKEGLRFSKAYCNVPVCGASRASLLTGIKPTRDRFVQFDTYAEKHAPGATSLPGHFRNNGYYTISNGKIFHHADDMLNSWSEEPWRPQARKNNWRDYVSHENLSIADSMPDGRAWPFEAPVIDDTAYFDGKIAKKSKDDLKRLAAMNQPFFLAVGFLKPHLPFNAPQKYWDLYDSARINLPDNYFIPENAPPVAIHNFGELRNYYGVPKTGPVADEMAKKLIHGYYACVSYTDAMIGQLLNTLDELKIRENTIVILWGDHGWQLGDHTLWCKHSNFNVAMRVPLLISAPGFKPDQVSAALVEYIDIFPTLCELADLPKPTQLQGKSFVKLMDDPKQPFKQVIYSRYVQGETIKTDRYMYSEWYDKQGSFKGRMLYDHGIDPDENINISEMPENANLVDSLSLVLHREMEAAKQVNLTVQ